MTPKTILFARVLVLTLSILFSNSNLSAQNFRATGIRVITTNPDSCANTIVEVDTYLGCINWTMGPSSFSISGNTITLEVNYTSAFICAGAISMPVFNINLGNVPSGNYTLVADAYLDNSLTNSFTGSTISVSSCLATGIQQNSRTNSFLIYPNPTSEKLNIKVSGIQSTQINYQLIDVKGSIISSGDLNVNSGYGQLNTSAFPRGVYVLRLQNGSEIVHEKISLL